MTIVVDASALGALLFDEPEAGLIGTRIAEETLIGPELLPFEIANACVVRERRDPAAPHSAAATFAIFVEWNVKLRRVDHEAVISLAARTRLTAYDASYLWLARHLGCELVTLDRRLSQAASAIP